MSDDNLLSSPRAWPGTIGAAGCRPFAEPTAGLPWTWCRRLILTCLFLTLAWALSIAVADAARAGAGESPAVSPQEGDAPGTSASSAPGGHATGSEVSSGQNPDEASAGSSETGSLAEGPQPDPPPSAQAAEPPARSSVPGHAPHPAPQPPADEPPPDRSPPEPAPLGTETPAGDPSGTRVQAPTPTASASQLPPSAAGLHPSPGRQLPDVESPAAAAGTPPRPARPAAEPVDEAASVSIGTASTDREAGLPPVVRSPAPPATGGEAEPSVVTPPLTTSSAPGTSPTTAAQHPGAAPQPEAVDARPAADPVLSPDSSGAAPSVRSMGSAVQPVVASAAAAETTSVADTDAITPPGTMTVAQDEAVRHDVSAPVSQAAAEVEVEVARISAATLATPSIELQPGPSALVESTASPLQESVPTLTIQPQGIAEPMESALPLLSRGVLTASATGRSDTTSSRAADADRVLTAADGPETALNAGTSAVADPVPNVPAPPGLPATPLSPPPAAPPLPPPQLAGCSAGSSAGSWAGGSGQSKDVDGKPGVLTAGLQHHVPGASVHPAGSPDGCTVMRSEDPGDRPD